MIYNHYEQNILESSQIPSIPVVLKAFENVRQVLVLQKVISNMITDITAQSAIELLEKETQKNAWRVGIIDYDFTCPLQYQILDNQVLDAYEVDSLAVIDVISLVNMDAKTIKSLQHYKRYHSFSLCPNAFCYDNEKTLDEHIINKKFAYYPLTVVEQNKRLKWSEKSWRYDIDLHSLYQRFVKEKSTHFR